MKTALATLAIAALLAIPAPAVPAEIHAIDSTGGLWVVGSGDDCNAAWVGAWAHVPADWVEVYCVNPAAR